MKRGLVVIILIFLIPFTFADEEEVSCSVDDDCFAVLGYDYICASDSFCAEDLDYDGIPDAEETSEQASGDSCVAHQDCQLGEACDYTSYTCAFLESLAAGTCRTSSECNEGYECFYRYCLLEDVGVSAGITGDNPYLSWADNLVDTVRSTTSSNPQVQQHIVQEALKESQVLDQRRAQGQISEQRYSQAQTQVSEKTVQGIQRGYEVLSQQSAQGGQGYQNSLQQFNSFSGQAQTNLQSLQNSQGGNGQLSKNVQQLQSQLGSAQQSLSQSSGLRETYACDSLLGDTFVGNLLVSPQLDGLYFTDIYGYTSVLYATEDGFAVSGDSLLVYVSQASYVGSEVLFSASSSSSSSLESQSQSVGGKEEGEVSSSGQSSGQGSTSQSFSGQNSRQQQSQAAPSGGIGSVGLRTGLAIYRLRSLFGDHVFAGTGRAVGGFSGAPAGQQQAPQQQQSSAGASASAASPGQSSFGQSQSQQGNQFGQSQQQGQFGSSQQPGNSEFGQSQGGNESSSSQSSSSQGQTSTNTGSASYTVGVDGQDVGTIDLNQYGQSVLGLGDSVVYSYEAGSQGVKLLVGDSLYISVSPGSVSACQLSLLQQEQQVEGEGLVGEEGISGGEESLSQGGQVGTQGNQFGQTQEQGQFGSSQQTGNSQFGQAQGQGAGISGQRSAGQQGTLASGGQRQGVSGQVGGQQSGVSGQRSAGQQGTTTSGGQRQTSSTQAGAQQDLSRQRSAQTQQQQSGTAQGSQTGTSPSSGFQQASGGTAGGSAPSGSSPSQPVQQQPTGTAPTGSAPSGPVPTGQAVKELFTDTSQSLFRFLFYRDDSEL